MIQPSLWDIPSPKKESIELSFSWADGDTNYAELTRLASQILKNTQVGRDDLGRSYLFIVESTRIENERVIATCHEHIALERELGMWMFKGNTEENDTDEEC